MNPPANTEANERPKMPRWLKLILGIMSLLTLLVFIALCLIASLSTSGPPEIDDYVTGLPSGTSVQVIAIPVPKDSRILPASANWYRLTVTTGSGSGRSADTWRPKGIEAYPDGNYRVVRVAKGPTNVFGGTNVLQPESP